MNADGSGQTKLTDSGFFDGSPSWSPDGTKIALTRNPDGVGAGEDDNGETNIYVMNADGSGVIPLTNTGTDSGPSWSPDGTKIAFVSLRTDDVEIFVMNADGTFQSNLKANSGSDRVPDWGVATPPADTEAPTIDAADITLERNTIGGYSGPVPSPSASDNQDPNPVVTHSPNPLPSLITFDGLEVTWTATDASGNSASDLQTVSVADTTPPVLTVPPEVEVLQGQSTDPSVTGQATATDICDGIVDISFTDSQLAADNTFVRTWTATDDHLNQTSATQEFIIVIPVNIDIKPGKFPNSVNLRTETTISLAVLGSSTFDVKKAVINTIKFGDLGTDPGAAPKNNKGSYSDVNKDGFLDLILKFSTPQTGIDKGDVEACLKGKLLSGAVFKGCDSVRTV